jgi:hypothetical protein
MLVATLLCGGCDRTSQSFSDYEELKRRGALQGGWFPDWLPDSSYDIEEAHDIDTNQSMLSAKYNQSFFAPPAPCEPVPAAPAAPFKKRWWPTSGALTAASGWHLYACPYGEYAAVNQQKQLLLHWRPKGS